MVEYSYCLAHAGFASFRADLLCAAFIVRVKNKIQFGGGVRRGGGALARTDFE
jgi:hypothetical protein